MLPRVSVGARAPEPGWWTGPDDLELGVPDDSGAEEEVRALLFDTPPSLEPRPDPLEVTVPRDRRLPKRVPPRTPPTAAWLLVPVAAGVGLTTGAAGVLAVALAVAR